jgi:hypothetical protein
MLNECLDRPHDSIYQCMERGCLNCKSQRCCPGLVVIAMRRCLQERRVPCSRFAMSLIALPR